MSTSLSKDLEHLRTLAEDSANPGRYGQHFHLMPPVGWLNDPNGLCQFNDVYHAFFQYSPFNAEGGVKMWGHSVSDDLIKWDYVGTPLYPDQPFDVSGVYSGCAYVEDGVMNVFYTGNVKKLDAAGYDYVCTGREANTIRTSSKDGINFEHRHVVMGNEDYPADDTEHVRDPKVWRDGDTYYMVQGARRTDDRGEVLVFKSDDMERWTLLNRITTEYPFGYMWECPDYFRLPDLGDGNLTKVLSVSPQGLTGGDWDRRNVYQSGYFVLRGDPTAEYRLQPFALWDAGFDFYAPQTFQADDGRRILIGWMGMPDEKTYTNPTVEDGWQHCFTIPREVSVRYGRVLQWPVREIEGYRANLREAGHSLFVEGSPTFDLEIDDMPEHMSFVYVKLADEFAITWGSGVLELRFLDDSKDGVGAGRHVRYEHLARLENMRIVGDMSSVEVFVNNGELTFSTRYYPKKYKAVVDAPGAHIQFWDLTV